MTNKSTAVIRTESVELVRSIGADEVIDYRTEDFTRRNERYDVLFDIGGNRPLQRCRRITVRKGAIVVVGGPAGRWLAPATRMFEAALLSTFIRQRIVPFISKNDSASLARLAELAQTGLIRAVIDRQYPLREAAEAIKYVGAGHARGKVLVNVR